MKLGLPLLVFLYFYKDDAVFSFQYKILKTRIAGNSKSLQNHVFMTSSQSRGISVHGVNDTTVTDGTVTFYQDLQSVGKPPLLFLPGLDGTGNYSTESLLNLTYYYDVWRMSISPDDRSQFIEVGLKCVKFMTRFREPPILVGESFGGLLASYIATIAKVKPSKLVLVNPATSFDRTNWNTVAPLLTNTGAAFPMVGMATLLATAVEFDQFQRIGRKIIDRINSTETAIIEMNLLFESSKTITERLPPETLDWRISKWLSTGSYLMNSKFKDISVPTLIIVGQNDRLLPSQTEGTRLQKAMNSSRVELIEFKDRGHAILDGSFNLAEVLMNSKTFRPPRAQLPIDIPFPSPEDILEAEKQTEPIMKLTSPVFLSRDPTKRVRGRSLVQRGLGSVPTGLSGRPILLVGNHQFFGLDLGLLVREFLQEKNVLIRGLAHPLIFTEPLPDRRVLDKQGQSVSTFPSFLGPPRPAGNNTFGSQSLFTRFGAVEVTPANYLALLRRNETILLFPGGAKEAVHRKGEANTLFWPNRTDFIRMAAACDAIVVPFAAIGMSDSVRILLDRDDLVRLPLIGQRLLEDSKKLPQARPGGDDVFISPVFAPKLPDRNYFIFQEPFDTRGLNVYNKTQCREAYEHLRAQVNEGIDYLQRFREQDPYRQFLPRLAYEVATGRQAPTATLNQ